MVICSLVGIEAFYLAFNDTDPDPIYICQEFHLCPVITGGAAVITNFTATPTILEQGATVIFEADIKCTSQVGPGLTILHIFPAAPTKTAIVAKEFFVTMAPANYEHIWHLKTVPYEDEPFYDGTYIAYAFVCEGDCTTDHPNGRTLSRAETKFEIQS
jgi:hypothetical protein